MAQKDITEKTLEAYNDVFADIMNVSFFRGEPVVYEGDLEDAQPRSYYKADGKLREQERDVSKYWLSREQVAQFRSDFRIVADYFVQMRENGDYVPSKETIRHVQEVMELMAVMTGDTRFEEVYQEGAEGKNMCEFLDRLEARGEARGLEQGIARGLEQGIARGEIQGMIKACLEFGMDAAKILAKIMSQYQLTEQEAGAYLEEIRSA